MSFGLSILKKQLKEISTKLEELEKSVTPNKLSEEELQAKMQQEDQKFRLEELHKIGLLGLSENSRELDKIILGLSVGSLGFLLSFFLKDYSFNSDIYNLTLFIFILSIISYTYSIWCILEVFYINNEYFKRIIAFRAGNSSCDIEKLEEKMKLLDKKVRYSFFFSIVISALFIISIALNKNIESKEKNTNEKKTEKVIENGK